MSGDEVGDVLLISLSNIGDALMTTPVLEALHYALPEARIDIVADRRSSDIFTYCPYRGEIFHREKRAGWRGTWQLLNRLRAKRYRYIVDMRTDGLAYLLKAERRLTRWRAFTSEPHAVHAHMSVLAPLLSPQQVPPTKIWLTEQLLAAAAQKCTAYTPYLAVAPGANWPGKIWPTQSYRELIAASADLFSGVVLLGSAADRTRAADLAADLALPCIDLTGTTNLLEAAALLAGARAFVGNDSGLGHIAAAVRVPTLTVFGPGEPQRYCPWGERAAWIRGANARLDALSADEVSARLRSHLLALTA